MTKKNVFTEEEKLKIFSDIVAIETVDKNEEAVAIYLADLFTQHGIKAEVLPSDQPTRANLVAEIGFGDSVLAISGHMDVVSAGDYTAWSSNPFTLTEEGNRLVGRGAADMKSGLAALAIAMIEVNEQGLLHKGRLRFLATFGEENGAPGSKALEEAGYVDDVDAMIIGEPTPATIHPNHKGSMNIVVSAKGKSVHSSRPRGGKNAIVSLLHFIERVTTTFNNAVAAIDFTALDFSNVLDQFGAVAGDSEGNAELSDLLKKPLLNVTVFHAGNQVNTIPDAAEVYFNIRTVPEFDNQAVKKLFAGVLAECKAEGDELTMTLTLDAAPVDGDPNSELLAMAIELSESYLADKPTVGPMTGATDASYFVLNKPAKFPVIIFGPGGNCSHQIDEYVEKDNYLSFIDLYVELISRYSQK